WPGRRYVDWIGVSGFNWGTANPLSAWKGFDGVMLERYDQLLAYHLPILRTERGGPQDGGDQPARIGDHLAAAVDHYPRLWGVIRDAGAEVVRSRDLAERFGQLQGEGRLSCASRALHDQGVPTRRVEELDNLSRNATGGTWHGTASKQRGRIYIGFPRVVIRERELRYPRGHVRSSGSEPHPGASRDC